MKLKRFWRHSQLLAIVLLFALAACKRNTEEIVLDLPPTPPLSRAVIGYGVINVSFAQIMEAPGQKGISQGYKRQGSIVEVLERRTLNAGAVSEFWVLIAGEEPEEKEANARKGWIRESMVDIYDNRRQAETAARVLLPSGAVD